MSGYNIDYFLKDFAERTIANLECIEEMYKKNNSDVYEVTQLINSLLGLIIIPVESIKGNRNVMDNRLKQHSPEEYNEIVEILKKCKKDKRFFSDYPCSVNSNGDFSVYDFIKHVRNAIAHGGDNGIHFFPIQEGGVVSAIILYDTYNDKDEEKIYEFAIKLSIEDLKSLVATIPKICCTLENKFFHKDQKIYNSNIKALESLMKEEKRCKTKTIFEIFEIEANK